MAGLAGNAEPSTRGGRGAARNKTPRRTGTGCMALQAIAVSGVLGGHVRRQIGMLSGHPILVLPIVAGPAGLDVGARRRVTPGGVGPERKIGHAGRDSAVVPRTTDAAGAPGPYGRRRKRFPTGSCGSSPGPPFPALPRLPQRRWRSVRRRSCAGPQDRDTLRSPPPRGPSRPSLASRDIAGRVAKGGDVALQARRVVAVIGRQTGEFVECFVVIQTWAWSRWQPTQPPTPT